MSVTKVIQMRPPGVMRDGLHAFIDQLPDQCEMVELGSYAGESTEMFLRKATHITCVDPWEDYLEKAKADETIGVRYMDEVEAVFDALQARYPDRIRKIKGKAKGAAALFADHSVDVVYVDSLHEYLDVVADIQAWFPKVKDGGIIAGHDYDMIHPGVPRAVIDMLGVPDAVFADGTWAKRVGTGPKVYGPAPTLKLASDGPSPKVLIGIPTAVEHAGYTAFNVALDVLMGLHDNIVVFRSMGGVVPGARNRIVREAIGIGAEYIWFLDNDQPFFAHDAHEPQRPDDLTALMKHGVDAVVPLSPRRGNPFLPLLFTQIDDDGTYALQRYLLPDDKGLIPVAAAGLGGLLIKTAVMEKIGMDGWFHFQHPSDDFDNYAEDIPFYKKLERIGVQLYCDLEVRFGHAVTTVAYIMRQQGQWVTVLADTTPFVAFPQPQHPLGLAFSEKQRHKQPLVEVG